MQTPWSEFPLLHGGETHLINTVDTTGSPHTGQFLAELALKEIARAEEMFGVRVVAAVTDNTSNMVGFREEVQKSKKLYCFGYQSHMFKSFSARPFKGKARTS